MDYNKIGKFISTRRKEKNLTQNELGEKLYVTGKAISKWERGLSVPDIGILENLSRILDVEIEELLHGELGNKRKVNIEKEINKIKEEITKVNKKNKIKLISIFSVIIIILMYFIFRFIYLGYNIKQVQLNHIETKEINLGIPKTSFMLKENSGSYSLKNFRSSHTLNAEIKNYLKELEYRTCNNTIYYYNKEDDFSIIEYSVKDNILFSTISYHIRNKDYCYTTKLDKYSEKLGILHRVRGFNNYIPLDKNGKPTKTNVLAIELWDGGKGSSPEYRFELELDASIFKDEKRPLEKLEHSKGTYEIKGNKVYYYRTEIIYASKKIDIPEVSVFEIDKDKNLILIDNYFKKYEKEVILYS